MGQITAMIHSGSRGLGHQVCSEHVANIEKEYSKVGDTWYSEKWGFSVPDRQLASAPIHSSEGPRILMRCVPLEILHLRIDRH